MSLTMPELTGTSKRLVVLHSRGPLAGLYRIMGTADQATLKTDGKPPEFFGQLDFTSHKADISLVKVHQRWAEYREVHETMEPDTPAFSPLQR